MIKLKLTKTESGKPKLIDNNGFTVATAQTDYQEDFEYFERLVISYNLLSELPTDYLKDMQRYIES
jgi:hypothetical protein